jgi:predicted flap endonuclease-1-like 5' DNA nuclease
MHMTQIADIEGIGPAYAKKLTDAGVHTVEALLQEGSTPTGRTALAEKTGIEHTLILKWVNRADLARIKGVGSEYADLLEASGVDTVVELGKRVPANLLKKMTEINEAKKLVRRLPVEKQVETWVEEAKKLERVVSY